MARRAEAVDRGGPGCLRRRGSQRHLALRLIVAADNTYFSDPVVKFGVGGVEYHVHTWELGARRAKEMLFTARKLTAAEAFDAGMVNRVVPLDELDTQTMDLAREIAQMDPWGLATAKRAVNQTLDIMGQQAALQSAFDIHWHGHANACCAPDIRS